MSLTAETDPAAVAAVLRSAGELLKRKSAWTRLVKARNASGAVVDPTDPYACCWCIYGALLLIADRHAINALIVGDALAALRNATGSPCLANWNDAPKRTHTQVRAAFDRALALIEPTTA